MGDEVRTPKLRRLAAGLAFASQGIHLWVLPGQLAAAMFPGIFFFGVAVGQGLLGASLLFGGGRWTARFGVLFNVFVILVWLFTSAVSIPQLFEPIKLPVEGLGGTATAIEFTLVVVLMMLKRSIPRKKKRGASDEPCFGERRRKGTSVMAAPPGIRWVRVLPAVVAVHVVGLVVSVALIVAYSVVTAGGSVDRFAGPLSTWILPVLTLPAAVWVARGARREAAVLNGLLVGLLVAGILGLLFFWPYDLRSVALFALIVAAGFSGGLLGGRGIPPRR